MRTISIGIAMLLSTLLVSNVGFAASCYEKSPNLALLGDEYYELDKVASLTPKEKKKLDALLKKLVGQWKGKGSTFQCIGSEADPAIENRPFTLTARTSTNASNELHIEIEKYFPKEKMRVNEYLFFLGDRNSYQSVSITAGKIIIKERFQPEIREPKLARAEPEELKTAAPGVPDSEAQNSDIDNIVKDSLSLLLKTMYGMITGGVLPEPKLESKPDIDKKTESGFSPLFEMVHTIEYSSGHFAYRLRSYINGYLAIEEQWKLRRD